MQVAITITFSIHRAFYLAVAYSEKNNIDSFELIQKPNEFIKLNLSEEEDLRKNEEGLNYRYFKISEKDLRLLMINHISVQVKLLSNGEEYLSNEINLSEFLTGRL